MAAVRQATYVKLLGRLAQGGVVLLNEVPTDLILTEVGVRSRRGGGISGSSDGRLIGIALVLFLRREVSVGRHGCECDISDRAQLEPG